MDLLKTLGDPELRTRVKACQIDPALILLGRELGEGKSFIIPTKEIMFMSMIMFSSVGWFVCLLATLLIML